MTTTLILGAVLGAGAGALLGHFGSCSTGACPLTANPWRGGLYGAVLGLLIASSVAAAKDPPRATGAKPVQAVTRAGFTDAVKTGVVLVDFWAPWCGPCRRQAPILEEVQAEPGLAASIRTVNIDEEPALAKELLVDSVPTFILYRDGAEAGRWSGLQTREQLLARLGHQAKE